jgi:uncharacterized protein YutE (UPF0331/DUF86 family)
MDEIYRQAMQEQVAELAEEISEIAEELETGQYRRTTYRAAERTLQLLVEACIGIAKQTLKGQGKEVPSEARQAFSKLRMLGLDPTDAQWDKIIGMRNALVHDYLNLDPERVLDVIRQGRYKVLVEFASQRLHS